MQLDYSSLYSWGYEFMGRMWVNRLHTLFTAYDRHLFLKDNGVFSLGGETICTQ